jgi:uncharacterized protein (DUF1015 family)
MMPPMAEIAPFRGVLQAAARDTAPTIYRHHQIFEDHGKPLTRKGFIARVRLDDGAILTHERSQPAQVEDRLKQLRQTGTRVTPPFGIYSDRQNRIDELFAPLEREKAALEVQLGGIVHQIWRLTDEKTQAQLASILSIERIYLADGQPELEAMLGLRKELAAGKPADSALHFGPIYLCNDEDPALISKGIHRVLFGLPAFNRETLLRSARDYFTVAEGPLSGPEALRPALLGQSKRGPAFGVVVPGVPKVAFLRIRADLIKASMPQLAESRARGELDVIHLHGLIFNEIFGLALGAEDAHVRYQHDWDQAFAELSNPEVQAVFFMNPVKLDLLRAVVDEGRSMPDHSTWFHPKFPPGLLSDPIDVAEIVRIPSLY